jgi:LysR family transcriptional regulator, low CO2-responsive transcriptional regulator
VRIEPEPLITFAQVADAGSVSAAAERLHRTQPAVSAQLRKLTEAVGEPLYRRHRHGVRLTAAGEALLPYARAVAAAVDGAQRWSDELGGLLRGAVRVAASMTVAVYQLPPALAAFRKEHPNLRIELLTRNSTDAAQLLATGHADLAIVEGPLGELPVGVEASVFGLDWLALVVHPDHPLRSEVPLPLSALAGLEVVRREPGSGTRDVVDRALLDEGVDLVAVLEATGLDTVKQAVLAGIGAGFLSASAVRREVEAGTLRVVPLASRALVRPLTLLQRTPGLASRAARALVAHLERRARELAPARAESIESASVARSGPTS